MTSSSRSRRLGAKTPRKQRRPTACYPCRQRKVKCDGVPCSSCTLRGLANACSLYKTASTLPPGLPQRPPTTSAAGSNISCDASCHLDVASTTESARIPEQEPVNNAPLSGIVNLASAPGITPFHSHEASDDITRDCSISQRSFPNHITHLAAVEDPQPRSQRLDKIWTRNSFELVSDGSHFIMPLEDFSSPQRSIAELCLALPPNVQIQRYYQLYLDVLLPVYPGVVNRSNFEAHLRTLLEDRDRVIASADRPFHCAYRHDASWFALLFAVLACGAQCLSTIESEAELNSKVLGSVAFSLLRKSNFLATPTINSVQALLHIGNSLRNDMNPGVAWSLLGLTIRHAQVIGCHEDQTFFDKNNPDDDTALIKKRLWWAIVWQDTISALCYNRPSGVLSVKTQLPPILNPDGRYTYADIIDRLCSVVLEICRQRLLIDQSDNGLPREVVDRLVRRIEEDSQQAQPHLLFATNCLTLRHHIEYFAVVIYKNSVLSHIYQSVQRDLNEDHNVQHQLSSLAADKCVIVIEAFLKLRQLSTLSSHFWSLIHFAVISAKFLSTQYNASQDSKAVALAKALILSLKSSCDETVGVINGFSTSLSQTVLELNALLSIVDVR